ncbi:MAG TPA: hypothetical protein VES66_03995 [Terriglobales bacterium]|nr:hypothetical protein [Terriglobales bacterium]
MKRRTKETSKLRAAAKPASGVRVIRVTEEAWAAKCVSLGKRGGPMEPAELFDRALRLTHNKAS